MSTFARAREALVPALRTTIFALVLFTPACGATLMQQRVEGQAKDWHLALTRVVDGPDEVRYAQYRVRAGAGERFLHLHVLLKNLSDHTRAWNWARCGLDHGTNEYLPVLSMPEATMDMGGGMEENLFRGEEIQRRVIVTYPFGDTLPTRLKCGDIVLPLQLQPQK